MPEVPRLGCSGSKKLSQICFVCPFFVCNYKLFFFMFDPPFSVFLYFSRLKRPFQSHFICQNQKVYPDVRRFRQSKQSHNAVWINFNWKICIFSTQKLLHCSVVTHRTQNNTPIFVVDYFEAKYASLHQVTDYSMRNSSTISDGEQFCSLRSLY